MIISLKSIAESIHKTNREKGFWEDCIEELVVNDPASPNYGEVDAVRFDPRDRNLGEAIALCHEELSEALGDHRDGRGFNEIYFEDKATGDKYTADVAMNKWGSLKMAAQHWKPCGVAIEFIDCWIRIMDLFGAYDTDVDKYLKLKRIYNDTRPYKHGRKF